MAKMVLSAPLMFHETNVLPTLADVRPCKQSVFCNVMQKTDLNTGRVEHFSIKCDKDRKPGTGKIFDFTILVTWDKIIFHHKFSVPKQFFS